MKVIHTKKQLIHAPKQFMAAGKFHPHPEVPERAEILMNAAKEFGLTPEQPKDYQLSYLRTKDDAEIDLKMIQRKKRLKVLWYLRK